MSAQGLAYRSESASPPGIYLQDAPDSARLLLGDTTQSIYTKPVVAGNMLCVHRCKAGASIPMAEEILFLEQGELQLHIPGQSVGISAQGGVAVVADLRGKSLYRADLEARDVTRVCRMNAGMTAPPVPIIGVNHDGTETVFMDATEDRCNGSLEWVDMRSGEKQRLRGPLPAPGMLAASFSPEGRRLAILEQRLAPLPSFRLTVAAMDGGEQELLTLTAPQPLTAPAFLDAHTLALPLALPLSPGVQWVAADITTATLFTLAVALSADVRCRAGNGCLWLEGGPTVLSVRPHESSDL
jgi:hypothetical protein